MGLAIKQTVRERHLIPIDLRALGRATWVMLGGRAPQLRMEAILQPTAASALGWGLLHSGFSQPLSLSTSAAELHHSSSAYIYKVMAESLARKLSEHKCCCFYRETNPQGWEKYEGTSACTHQCRHKLQLWSPSRSLVLPANCWHKYSNSVAHVAGRLILEIKTIQWLS